MMILTGEIAEIAEMSLFLLVMRDSMKNRLRPALTAIIQGR